MKRLFLCFSLIFIAVSDCNAESAYKWTDSQGRVIYGSKPPRGAAGVSTVRAHTYSRYKTSPALTKLKNSQGRGRLGNIKEADLPLPPPPTKDSFEIKTDAPTNEGLLELSAETPAVKVGTQDEIESCAVTIKNKTPMDVEGVQVSFEFADGTLVPAVGPARLNVGQGALYSVDSEQIPLKLENGTSTTPKVIINTDAETVIKPPGRTDPQ